MKPSVCRLGVGRLYVTKIFMSDKATVPAALFLLLLGNNWRSYMSMKENIFDDYFTGNGQQCQLVDYPGAESLRKNLFAKWMANVSVCLGKLSDCINTCIPR